MPAVVVPVTHQQPPAHQDADQRRAADQGEPKVLAPLSSSCRRGFSGRSGLRCRAGLRGGFRTQGRPGVRPVARARASRQGTGSPRRQTRRWRRGACIPLARPGRCRGLGRWRWRCGRTRAQKHLLAHFASKHRLRPRRRLAGLGGQQNQGGGGFLGVVDLKRRGTRRQGATGHSEDMRVQERFHRRDFGHMELTITITDPKTFTKPITFSVVQDLLPDTDLLEHYCLENEKDDPHFPGRTRPQ